MKTTWQRTDRNWDIIGAIMDIESGEFSGPDEAVEAWAFVAVNGYHRSLQGFYGRQVESLKDSGILRADGTPDWDEVDRRLAED